MKLLTRYFGIIFPLILSIIFFWQFFFKGLLPIPADTIVGLYHPYRDLFAKDYPRGIPYKNSLITDPVRQQYPWKNLSIGILKKFELPLWSPYEGAGKPLLANMQSGVFYPFNLLFFILPFNFTWGLLIFSEPLLAGIFMFLFLQNLKLNRLSSLLGSVVFSFSGFSISWLAWGNIVHTALWLPLILLSINKLLGTRSSRVKDRRLRLVWSSIFIFSLVSSFFAGHLQIFFYLYIASIAYFLFRLFENQERKIYIRNFLILNLLFLIIALPQWFSTLQFIFKSARSLDQNYLSQGWFIPWKNLVQFIAPDFFGNPATLNYWGVWNYAEFVGYVGIVPLILALFALFFKKDKNILFFGSLFFLSLIFALPNFISKIPYVLNIPLFSTAQPTRLIFLTDFSLSVLSAFGFSLFLKTKKKIFYPLGFIGIILSLLWVTVFSSHNPNFLISKQNLILPTILFVLISLILIAQIKFLKNRYLIVSCFMILITVFDLFRFGWKFTPFVQEKYLFPPTPITSFLKSQPGEFRVMAVDSRIFPPNFSTMYKIQTVDEYDPLYLENYAELIAASERRKPDIKPPFGFNRIITPHNFDSKIIDLLGVKYILSLTDINSPKLTKVFEEGQTKVYENKNALPRAFFVEKTLKTNGRQDEISKMFAANLETTAVGQKLSNSSFSKGEVLIKKYKENDILLETKNNGEGFLVLTDSFYPIWSVKVDGKDAKIYRTDYNFRGIAIPKGKHIVEFDASLF